MKRVFLCGVLAYLAGIASAFAAPRDADERGGDAGLQIYSDMGFIRDEGEYSGLQVIIIPYNHYYKSTKEKILWRSGEGYLDTPLLLEGVRDADKIKLTVPEGSAEHGEWVLTLNGNHLSAKGPRGLHHELEKMRLK
jgi:hypothetical protein